MPKPIGIIPEERVASRIYLMRHKKVMLDFDLAELYGVPTRVLNQAVTRNRSRFPPDFMFRLTKAEAAAVDEAVEDTVNPSQIVIGSQKHRDPRFPPRAFTQEGVAMLSGVLRSSRAIRVNIAIMRAFVKLAEVLATHEGLARKVVQHDQEIGILFKHVKRMLAPPDNPKRRKIGFAVAAAKG